MRTIPTLSPPMPTNGPVRPADAPARPTAAKGPHPSLGLGWTASAIMDDPTTAGVLHSAWSGDPAVVVPSPPGAGKTRLVVLLAATLAERAGLRVGVAAQTRDQAVEVARRLGALGHPAMLAWSAKALAPALAGAARIVKGHMVRYPPTGGGVIVATTARWLVSDPDRLACDLMIVDEAWQATYADVGALGAFAGQVVCVGDPGQIDPVVTGQTTRWADSPTGPHLPAPDALAAAHPDAVSVVKLRHTWRLGPDTTALIQPVFYPSLPFTSRRPDEYLSSSAGSRLPEVVAHPVTVAGGPGDPGLINACASLARDLLQHEMFSAQGARRVEPEDVAVVTPHVGQAAAVRALLADLPGLLVGTANQLQGLERAAVVALHPLAGYRDPSGFATNMGRACVMLSRHRAHLVVVTDATSLDVLRTPDPTPSMRAHTQLLEALGT